MERVLLRSVSVAALGAAASILVLMFATNADAFTRAATDASLPGMIELSEVCLVAAVFLGMSQAGVEGQHIVVTLVTDRLPAAAQKILRGIGWALVSVFLGWLAVATVLRAAISIREGEERFGLISWPVWPARIIVAVGVSLMLGVAVANVVRVLRGRRIFGETADGTLEEVGI